MTTLQEAAQQALEALELAQNDVHWEPHSPTRKFLRKVEKSLRAALAEPVQDHFPDATKMVQEPVAWMVYTEIGTSAYVTDNPNDLVGAHRALPLYTSPPQRLPLTEQEVNDLMDQIPREDVDSWSFRQGVCAAESAHGIGN